MPTQVVTFTPNTSLSQTEAMGYIASLLPMNVLTFLNDSDVDGGRTTSVAQANGTFTVTNEWTDAAANTYTHLMADVSAGVKTQLATDGWTISFNPETADL